MKLLVVMNLMNRFVDDRYGEAPRADVRERPGTMERVSKIEGRLERMGHELYPHSDWSGPDPADRTGDGRPAHLKPEGRHTWVTPCLKRASNDGGPR